MEDIGRALPFVAFWLFLALAFPPMCDSIMQHEIKANALNAELRLKQIGCDEGSKGDE